MSDDDKWPWYDPATNPPPRGVWVLLCLRNGKPAVGYRTDGKWWIAGAMLPAQVVTAWAVLPPLPSHS